MKDCTMHRHPRKWRQRGKWVTASVPSYSDASIVANRPWKPAKSRDIPLLRSSHLSLLSLEKKISSLRSSVAVLSVSALLDTALQRARMKRVHDEHPNSAAAVVCMFLRMHA